jgi:hypothetical protein
MAQRRKASPRAARAGATPAAAGPPTRAEGEDRSFLKILHTRSTDRILPELSLRLEGGRRRYASEVEAAAAAELAVLAEERRRLEREAPGDAARQARAARLAAAVELDLAATRHLREEIERAVPPVPGGFTVLGRVLTRDGAPARAEVFFAGADGQEVKLLGVIPVGKDGMVRRAYPADVTKRLEAERVRVVAAARVGRQVVGREQTPARVRAGGVHQFDLRVDSTG